MNQRICHFVENAFFDTTAALEINVTGYSAHLVIRTVV
jgi:hypothetical protein